MRPRIDIAPVGLRDAGASSVLVRQPSDGLRHREPLLPSTVELDARPSEGALERDRQFDGLPQGVRPRPTPVGTAIHHLVEVVERFLVYVTAEMPLGHATRRDGDRLKRVGGAA